MILTRIFVTHLVFLLKNMPYFANFFLYKENYKCDYIKFFYTVRKNGGPCLKVYFLLHKEINVVIV